MKTLCALLLVTAFAGSSFAFELPDDYTTSITGLEFFPSGAKFIFTVQPDEDSNTFEAVLPGAFKEDSIRLINPEDVQGNIKVENHSRTRWIPDGLTDLNAQAEDQSKIIDELTAKRISLEQTLNLLNNSTPDKSKPDELLKFIKEAQEVRLAAENELADIKIQINREKEKLTMLRNELTSRRPRGDTNYLLISGRARKPVTFEAFTTSAAWRPGYILDLNSSTGDISVKSYIRASQRTGLDYDGRIILHTRTPDTSITAPELRALTVAIKPREQAMGSVGNASYSRNNSMYKSARREAAMMMADRAVPMAEPDEDTMLEEAPEAPEITTVSETLSDTSLNIKGLITGDGRESEFEVIREQALILKSSPDIVLIPEQRNNAWIIANLAITPLTLNLIPGDCELRVDNHSSGNIYLSQAVMAGRKIPFGYIDNITVKREALIAKKGVSWFSGTQQDGYTLSITNGTDQSRLITVRDRMPIPTDDKIKLDVRRIEPAQTERTNENILTWKLEIPSGQTANIIVDYALSFPSGEELRYGTK